MLADLPKPPLGDLYDHLIDKAVTNDHAEALLSSGTLTGVCQCDLADALARAWLLYIQGHAITEKVKAQKAEAEDLRKTGRNLAADSLRTQPKAPPKQFGDHAFVQAMWIIWNACGPASHSGISYGDGIRKKGHDGRITKEHDGPLQRFLIDWLLIIDPDRRNRPPSRHIYLKAKSRMT